MLSPSARTVWIEIAPLLSVLTALLVTVRKDGVD